MARSGEGGRVTGGAFPQVAGGAYPQLEPEWVDEVLLAGASDDVCLHLGGPGSRAELRRPLAGPPPAPARAGVRPGRSGGARPSPPPARLSHLLAPRRR